MRILVNYIGLNVLKGILIVAILLLSVDLFFYFISELRFVGNGNYNLLSACEFVMLTIPRKLYTMSPWSALIGSLLVLGSMAQSSELLFMRTVGLSANRIALYGSVYVLLFTLLIFVFGELLAPRIESFAQTRKTLALSRGNTIYTSNGTWMRNHNKFIHVAKVQDFNTLSGITIYEFDEYLRLKKSSFARTAKLINSAYDQINKKSNSLWELENIVTTDFSDLNNVLPADKDNNIKFMRLATKQEENLLDLNILQTANVKHLERLSIKSLLAVIQDRINNNLAITDYKVAFWKKIVQPFSILVMSYLAVPFVLGPLRSCTRGLRLLVGVMLGASFYLLNALFCPLVTVINFPASIAAMLPSIIFLSLAVYLAAKA
jgi:lipopolysaccharide export system permease protein